MGRKNEDQVNNTGPSFANGWLYGLRRGEFAHAQDFAGPRYLGGRAVG